MGMLLPFNAGRKSRRRPSPKGGARGEIVLFTGVRIERLGDELLPAKPDAPPRAASPKTPRRPPPGKLAGS